MHVQIHGRKSWHHPKKPTALLPELVLQSLLELTNNAHAEIIDRLLGFNKPLLATGGGGYHFDNTVRGWALAWKIMCGVGDESDIALGMGGVMLQSTEWSGGLRDRVLPMDEQHCEAVETAVQATIRSLTRNVFKYHGI